MKKVLLIVVDAFASRVAIPAMQQGRLPNIQALANAGSLNATCSAIFPTITPAATASIVTGQYPRRHGILGFHWYDLQQDEVIYYGDDLWVVWNKGFGQFFEDFLVRLNSQQLQANTIFQRVEQAELVSASLNYLIFRGDVKHEADMPLLLKLIPGVASAKAVYGPSILYLGDLVDTEIEIIGDTLDETGGMFHRFGFDDENTGHLLLQLAKEEAMPDFTLAYFPDNDYCSHKVGPQEAVTSLEQVDAKIGQFIEILGGLEQALEKLCIIITGDHSQSDMVADEEAGIRLDQLLADFSIADPGLPWNEDDQLIICPDMRAAQIYFHYPDPQQLEQIVTLLIADPRVDQAIWRADLFDQDTLGYHVATAKRGRLHFWLESENEGIAVDDHANHWSWQGELETVDGLYSEQHLTFPTYPNAFERIAGALAAENSGHLWLTAKPGYEFQLADTSIHQGGGSHGSLHALDSTSPLLMAGAPPEVTIPSHPRTIDVAPLCLSILGFSAQPWSDSNQQ